MLNCEVAGWREEFRALAQREFAPAAASETYPHDLVPVLARYGLLGMTIPPEYGGSGGTYLRYAVALEEVTRACTVMGIIMGGSTSLACYPISAFGTEEQKRRFLTPLASGETLGCFALTEAGAGSDVSSLRTAAARDGTAWRVSGTKLFITNGERSGIVLVFASTDRGAGARGISTFIVEKGTPGFSVAGVEKKLGLVASDTAELVLDNCAVPGGNLLGNPGDGFKIAMKTLDGGRISISAQAIGIAQCALDECIAHALRGQASSFRVADMATGLEAARRMVYSTAAMRDAGLPHTKESAMTKLFVTDTCMTLCMEAVRLLGREGGTRRRHAEQLFRDIKAFEVFEGTNEIQRIVIARELGLR